MAATWSAKDNGSSQRKKRGNGGRVGIARSVSGGLDVIGITSLRSVPAGTFPCTDMYIHERHLASSGRDQKSPPLSHKTRQEWGTHDWFTSGLLGAVRPAAGRRRGRWADA